MAVRLPAGLIRSLLRFTLRPFLGPPFPVFFQRFWLRLASYVNAQVYAPNYRLAPEHPYPAALEDALAAYRWLLATGLSPSRIAIAGDSAGGGLALATGIAIRDSDLPAPAALALISPWADLRGDTPSMTRNARIDPMLRPSWSRQCSTMYLDGRDPGDPGCSPLFASHQDLPAILDAADEAIDQIATFLDARWH